MKTRRKIESLIYIRFSNNFKILNLMTEHVNNIYLEYDTSIFLELEIKSSNLFIKILFY